jgi:c-di-GMP-related signal transduction protein
LIDYLRLVESYEQADWQNMSTAAARLGVDEGNLPGAYLQACEWSNTFSKEPE